MNKLVITHDKEVFDISFSAEGNYFVTVGADQSARQFDIRDLTQSNIIYEASEPIVKVEFNNKNPYVLALSTIFDSKIKIFDLRQPLIAF